MKEILDDIVESVFKKVLELKVDDASVIAVYGIENMARFSNNSITVIDTLDEVAVFLYMIKDGKKVVGTTYSVGKEELDKFVERLFLSMQFVEKSSDTVPLPKNGFKYLGKNDYDDRIEKLGEGVVDYCERAINAALSEGAKRVSGTISANVEVCKIRTTGGIEEDDRVSYISANIRAFSETNSSGHGLSCSTYLSNFYPEEAGKTAGMFSRESRKVGHWNEGEYDLIIGPTVAADIFQMVGISASAFRVDTGTSFFKDCLGKKVAVENLTVEDHGTVEGGFGGRKFDDEGVPTRKNTIIENGVLNTYLHNTTTAKKYGTITTGNAGIIAPHPWNIVVKEGDMSVEEMIKECKRAVYVTNNWYTRYQNYMKGEYSTIPRDATFLIENGSIKYAINGTRISDSIPRQLSSIKAIGKERRWIKWWEVEIPVYTPTILVEKTKLTRAQF
ncbi:MAG: TldD/PmbA family protein [Nitrososphaeria archaeon]